MARPYRQGISASEAFAMIERAAVSGGRCPQSRTNGLTSQLTSELARAGHIRIDVYARNWRVVTILKGPHAGKATASAPNKKWRPYLTIQKDTPVKRQYLARI